MKISNVDTKLNVAIPRFRLNGVEFGYVQVLEDTEKYLRITYAVEHDFKRGKAYHVTYDLEQLLVNLKEYADKTKMIKTVDCGMCRLVFTERRVSHDECNGVTYVFKKIKNKR